MVIGSKRTSQPTRPPCPPLPISQSYKQVTIALFRHLVPMFSLLGLFHRPLFEPKREFFSNRFHVYPPRETYSHDTDRDPSYWKAYSSSQYLERNGEKSAGEDKGTKIIYFGDYTILEMQPKPLNHIENK